MSRRLSSYEKETIISFNEAEDTAYIFTYSKAWQKHLEVKLGLKPVMDNGFGGKTYHISKKRIRPPRLPRKLSPQAKAKAVETLHRNRLLSVKKQVITTKSNAKNQDKSKTIKVSRSPLYKIPTIYVKNNLRPA